MLALAALALPGPQPARAGSPAPPAGAPRDAVATSDVVRLEIVEAEPGMTALVPVRVTSPSPIERIRLVVRYDPALFEPQGVSFDGSAIEPATEEPAMGESLDLIEGEDTFVVTVPGRGLAAGVDVLAFHIVGAVAATAEPGVDVALELTNDLATGDGSSGDPLVNELTHVDGSDEIDSLPELESAVLRIIEEQTFFRRGDANSDDEINISDALATVHYLFAAGQSAPSCMDAADSNDDGEVNIADVVALISVLFSCGGDLPEPYPHVGRDLTVDRIRCPAAGER